jgi:hypothetical protein
LGRLDDELAAREDTVRQTEDAIRAKYENRKGKLKNLIGNGDFQEYLALMHEMNSPDVVVGIDCTDPKCMALKRQVRNHRRLVQLLEKLAGETAAKGKRGRTTNGTATS